MKPVRAAITAFIVGTLVGFAAIAFGYIAYADSTHYLDREGATGMGVVFFYAPLGGLLLGTISARIAFKICSRRTP
jgi:hypothetical protein